MKVAAAEVCFSHMGSRFIDMWMFKRYAVKPEILSSLLALPSTFTEVSNNDNNHMGLHILKRSNNGGLRLSVSVQLLYAKKIIIIKNWMESNASEIA